MSPVSIYYYRNMIKVIKMTIKKVPDIFGNLKSEFTFVALCNT